MKIAHTALIASTMLIASAGLASAAPVLGLTGDKTLVMFDTAKPAVTKTMEVSGVTKLVGIDFRPGTKTVMLSALGNVEPSQLLDRELMSRLREPTPKRALPIV